MNDEARTKGQLLLEIQALRSELARYKVSENEYKRNEEALRAASRQFQNLKDRAPFDEHDEPSAVNGIITGITEPGRTEEHGLQLEKAVETMRLGITITDLTGKILYTNPAEAAMHGYQVEELLGKDIGILAPPELRKPRNPEEVKKWKGLIRKSLNIRKDGSIFPVWLISDILKDVKGELCAIVTSCEDITKRKQTEEELQRYRAHLEELVKERTTELTTANEKLQQEIAERKRIEQALRESEEQYRTLFESLQDVFYRTDLQGNMLLTSPSIVQLLGFSRDEAARLNLAEDILAYPEQWQEVVSFTAKNGSLEEFEALLKRRDGSLVWGSATSQLYTDKEGQTLGIEGIIRDISERKQAEERYRTIVENLHDGLIIYDFNNIILDINENTCKIFGYPRDELIGENLRKISTKKASQQRELQLLKLDREDSKTFDSEGIRKDGGIIPISVSVKIVSKEGNGKIQSFVRDITARKKDEKLLKFNKERLETLVQINQMHEFSVEEISDYVLEKAVELTGSTLGLLNYVSEDNGAATPSPWSKSVIKKPEDEKPEHFLIKNTEIWTETFRKKTPVIINDYSLSPQAKKDCLEEYVELRRVLVVPVFDEDNIVLLSAVANKEEAYDETDVNELTLLMGGMWNHIKAKLAAEELRKAKEKAETANVQLRELNANKDTFFSIIAHDLRGPLSSLHELTQLIEENLDSYSQDDLKELIVFQKTAAEILYKLLENLLTWSRVQRGMIVYQPQHIDIKWLVNRAIDLLKVQAEGKRITLQSLIQEQMFLYADVNMVDTLIRNLISNALKFTHSGGTVKVSARQDEHEIEVAVSDTGVGIEAENLQKLFRIDARYKRAGTAQEEGTGLGLILCKEFIERHHGKIWVESQVDKGSVFRFTLPKNLKEAPS